MSSISTLRIKLRDRFIKFYTDDLVRISRRRHVGRSYTSLRRQYMVPITREQRDEIIAFWKPYRDVSHMIHWFELYNGFCDDKSQLKYFIPDELYFAEIDTTLCETRRADILDDKNLYDLFFHDVKTPEALVHKINGHVLDKGYRMITVDEAVRRCLDAGDIISKPTRLSCGGHGIRFFHLDDATVDEFKQWLSQEKNDNLIVQKVIKQHESLNRIHRDSINTIRIMSLVLDDQVHILSSVLRMGRNGSRLDNATSGGLICGIKEGGYLRECAFGNYGDRVTEHPQGIVFKGTKIEGCDKCYDVIRQVAGRLCSSSLLVSWDFAIDPDGEPVIVEVNLTNGGVNLHQMCNGPIFGDLTERVLEQVYGRN